MGPFFEQHPWAFAALIIVIVECWQIFKMAVSRLLRQLNRDGFAQKHR